MSDVTRDRWDKLEIVAKVLWPVVLAVVSGVYTYRQAQQEIVDKTAGRVAGYLTTLTTGNVAEQRVAVALLTWEAQRHPGAVPDDILLTLLPSLVAIARSSRDSGLAGAASHLATALAPRSDTVISHLATQPTTRVFLQIRSEEQRELAASVAALLTSRGFVAPGIERLAEGPARTEVRFFRQIERPIADSLASILALRGIKKPRVVYVPGYEASTQVRAGTMEIWFGPGNSL
jgi:hypothetical protein